MQVEGQIIESSAQWMSVCVWVCLCLCDRWAIKKDFGSCSPHIYEAGVRISLFMRSCHPHFWCETALSDDNLPTVKPFRITAIVLTGVKCVLSYHLHILIMLPWKGGKQTSWWMHHVNVCVYRYVWERSISALTLPQLTLWVEREVSNSIFNSNTLNFFF